MRARWAGLVVLMLALSGCGGIPTSGSVREGEVIDNENETLPEVTYRALGPQLGATPLEIMQGFIAAATNPQDNYEVARSFLDESVRGDWDPDESTQIRTGVGVPRQVSETSLAYSLTSGAYVNNRGQYVEGEAATQTLEFTVVQDENEEWRISSAPDGIVLSQEVFDTIFDAYPLYFFDPSNTYLIPDVRWFPKTTGLSTRIVRALLAGQSTYLAQGVTNTYIPASTGLNSSVSIDSGVATVDLTDTVLDASPEQSERMVQQLRASIGNVSDVVLTVNGVERNVPASTGRPAVINPQVETSLLVRQDDTFGFLRASGSVSALAGQAAEIVQLGAIDAVLARDQQASAVLAADGVHVVFGGNTPARLVDARPGLIAPAIDNDRFVWTVPADNAAAIRAFDAEGTLYEIDGSQFAGRAISITISRDGARLLMLLATDLGPQLYVAGIIRQDGVPVQLGAALPLRMPSESIPVDAAWVDDHTVATLTNSETLVGSTVTLYQLGGPSTSAGRVTDGVALVGGNGGLDGLRVLTADGNVFLPRGNGWADTNTRVTFIATQQ